MASEAQATKQALRDQVEAQRRRLSAAWVRDAGQTVCERLGALVSVDEAECIAGYLALPGEVDLQNVMTRRYRQGADIVVPAWESQAGAFMWAEWNPEMPMTEGPSGTTQPADPEWVEGVLVDVVLVPGVAFDLKGARLGRGGGHYDRLLADAAAVLIGVAFDLQMVPHVPTAAHDVSMDLIVTEQRSLEASQGA